MELENIKAGKCYTYIYFGFRYFVHVVEFDVRVGNSSHFVRIEQVCPVLVENQERVVERDQLAHCLQNAKEIDLKAFDKIKKIVEVYLTTIETILKQHDYGKGY